MQAAEPSNLHCCVTAELDVEEKGLTLFPLTLRYTPTVASDGCTSLTGCTLRMSSQLSSSCICLSRTRPR